MKLTLSENTKAILLLTAPLMVESSAPSADVLKPAEYRLLARHLRDIGREPADLVFPDSDELLRALGPVLDENRLRRLLARGFRLSQAVERWNSRSIWVISRADPEYPSRLKARLKEGAPALLYGCGDMALLESGGLAVVGSRDVPESLIDYTAAVGKLAAQAGKTVISGGARGVDTAAVRRALRSGGKAVEVLADSLERKVVNREYRNWLLEGQLVLLSHFDPGAAFTVGNAMQRNRLIYAMSDASLVVNSDIKGGTWEGASEQLDKLRYVPLYIRSTGAMSPGLEALRDKGALAWPNPSDADSFTAEIFPSRGVDLVPADELFRVVSSAIMRTLKVVPVKESVIAAELDVTTAQAKAWLQRLVDEALIEKRRKPAGFALREKQLFDSGEFSLIPMPAAGEAMSAKEEIFEAARAIIMDTLQAASMKESEVAVALKITNAQARSWLLRLVTEGELDRLERPVAYAIREKRLFDPDVLPEVLPTVSAPDATQARTLLFEAARSAIVQLLSVPMKDSEVAVHLDITNAQAKAWLKRLISEGLVEKRLRPLTYVNRQKMLSD